MTLHVTHQFTHHTVSSHQTRIYCTDISPNLCRIFLRQNLIPESRPSQGYRLAKQILSPSGPHSYDSIMLDVIIAGINRYKRSRTPLCGCKNMGMVPRGQPSLPSTGGKALLQYIDNRKEPKVGVATFRQIRKYRVIDAGIALHHAYGIILFHTPAL